jgi:hypothetical protein
VYRYDVSTNQVTKTHNDNDGVYSIAFSPAEAAVMYLGLVVEEIR